MKRIILHIGTEKTATTSLQSFFASNHQKLSAAGIWYPCDESLDYCHRSAHFPLAAAFMEDTPDFVARNKYFEPGALFEKLFRDFDKRPEHTLLLSAEHFSSRCSRPERNEQLGNILRDRDVKILVYLRPQHEMLVSSYSTFLESGGKKTLEDVSRQMWLRPQALYFNHLVMVQRWLENFRKEDLSVRIFQPRALAQGDIYSDVMDFLGISLASPTIPDRLNPPISKELADFLYLANQHFPTWRENDRAGWEMGQQFRAEVSPLFTGGSPIKNILSPDLKAETVEYFADYNRKLCELVRPDLQGQLFYDEPGTGTSESATEASANSFTPEFVDWVIQQWSSKRPPGKKDSGLIR